MATSRDTTAGRQRDAARQRRGASAAVGERPTNVDAERAVLGSILIKPDVCDDVSLIVRPEDFSDESHQLLFRHLLDLNGANKRIDTTIVLDVLRTKGDLDRVGGAATLADVVESVPHAAHATHYAQIVRDKALLCALIDAGTDILRDAYDGADEPELLAQAESRIFSILERRSSTEAKSIEDVLTDVMARMDARMKHEHLIGGVETGFTELDSLCGGLHNSELIILAARPSMGKTALAMNIAEHVAIGLHQPVLFVSLEMACLELADRLLCSAAQVNGHRLRNGTISQEDRRRLVQKSTEIGAAPLFIDDTPGRTLTEIAAVARRLKRKKDGLALIVIDYLQLIEPDNPRDPRQEQVARIARRLKMMARELEIPVLCLAQLNRQAEVSRANRPRPSHLRESGAIEQDADVVMFVHREEYYQTTDEDRERVKGQAEIIISKQRNGPIGDVKLLWQHDYTRFVNLEHRPYDEFESF